MKTKYLTSIIVLSASALAFGQPVPTRPVRPLPPVIVAPPVQPSLAQLLKRETLGTRAEGMEAYSKDLRVSVRMALPSYEEQGLSRYFESVAKKYANGEAPVKLNLETIQKVFQIQIPGEGERHEKDFSYEIKQDRGQIYVRRNLDQLPSYPLERGYEEQKLATRTHTGLLSEFGLDASKIYSFRTNLILTEGQQKLADGRVSAPSKPEVDNVFSYGVRGLEGLMVDGSYMKVISKDAKTFEGLDIRFPRFLLHRDIKQFELKGKEEVMKLALDHLARIANPKMEHNVRMAVVFREVLQGGRPVFIPALKVGLYSRPIADREAELKAEAGELFYVDLLRQPLNYEVPKADDGSEGGREG